MNALQAYQAVVFRGGCIVPRGDSVIVKAPKGDDFADLRDALRTHRDELVTVARWEREEFKAQWIGDVRAYRDGVKTHARRWSRETWQKWARTMVGLWVDEELAQAGVEDELRWLKRLASGEFGKAAA